MALMVFAKVMIDGRRFLEQHFVISVITTLHFGSLNVLYDAMIFF